MRARHLAAAALRLLQSNQMLFMREQFAWLSAGPQVGGGSIACWHASSAQRSRCASLSRGRRTPHAAAQLSFPANWRRPAARRTLLSATLSWLDEGRKERERREKREEEAAVELVNVVVVVLLLCGCFRFDVM